MSRLLLATAAMLAAFWPSLCNAAPVEISVDTAFPEYFDMHKAIGDAFMKAHPDIVVKFNSPAKTYDELLQRSLRNAITGDGADVAFQSYNFVQQTADRNLAVPLDEMIAAETDWSGLGYLPNITTMARANGKIYGLPFNTSIPFIYYNLNQANNAGWDVAKLPQSWTDVARLSKGIAEKSGPGTGLYFDYYYIVANLTFDALLKGQGGAMMSADLKQIRFDGADGMKALETLRELGASGMMDTTRDQAIQSFKAGSLGIYASTSSSIIDFRKAAGESGFTLGCSTFPLPDPDGRFPAGGNAGMILSKDPAKQRAAWEYIKFAGGEVGQFLVAKYTGYIPTNTKVLANPEFRANRYSDPCVKAAVDQLSRITGPFTFPGPNAQRISNALRDLMREAVTQKQTPAQIMPQMVDAAKRMLAN
ncbi:extracellular solute-binding protein [Labrys wisconsinensis]|uniref:Multiple sugar transport system substrate-binding protein n=1 Tax=Labrys wisconsinensis TaxID=425677 RepID=A0ABU0JIS1_9HYPH|nr:extracellular solute-binding protein [Labrys wisconsinensis]MDQ0473520.1 multiple sugar transport system substrate-binding protein [Labrys wisconsinensis]